MKPLGPIAACAAVDARSEYQDASSGRHLWNDRERKLFALNTNEPLYPSRRPLSLAGQTFINLLAQTLAAFNRGEVETAAA